MFLAILAATLVPGTTTIENCAKEPHVVDVANFLNSMGANISGVGTDRIEIAGVKKLSEISPEKVEIVYLAKGKLNKIVKR